MNFEAELIADLTNEHASHPKLKDAILYSVLAEGKRLRPHLLLNAGALLKIEPEPILPAALAVEYFHTYTLIHDDLPCMDDDDFRRGQLANHKVYGENLALLAGNCLLSLSVEKMLSLEKHFGSTRTTLALSFFLKKSGMNGVMGGQALELLTDISIPTNRLRVNSLKTAALFESCLLIPAILADLRPESDLFQKLFNFGSRLGEAFQLQDDLQDNEQSIKKLEKNEIYTIIKNYKTAENQIKTEPSFAPEGVESLMILANHSLAELHRFHPTFD